MLQGTTWKAVGPADSPCRPVLAAVLPIGLLRTHPASLRRAAEGAHGGNRYCGAGGGRQRASGQCVGVHAAAPADRGGSGWHGACLPPPGPGPHRPLLASLGCRPAAHARCLGRHAARIAGLAGTPLHARLLSASSAAICLHGMHWEVPASFHKAVSLLAAWSAKCGAWSDAAGFQHACMMQQLHLFQCEDLTLERPHDAACDVQAAMHVLSIAGDAVLQC